MRYRPFTIKTLLPHRDRWLRLNQMEAYTKIEAYGSAGIRIPSSILTYEEALDELTFEDGTPFGEPYE